MPLEIVTGDIEKMSVDVIVIPALMHAGGKSPVSEKIYNAAGYEDVMKELEPYGELKLGEFVVTSGYDLKAEKIIHMYPMRLTDTLSCVRRGQHQNCFSTEVLFEILAHIEESDARSAAIMMYREGFSLESAIDKFRCDINWWLLAPKRSHIKIYLVIPTDYASPALLKRYNIRQRQNALAVDELDFRERADYRKKRLSEYLSVITNATAFANSIKCQPSTITRFSATSRPQKTNALMIMVGLKLKKEQRYEFMDCTGHNYPADNRDFALEKILEQGVTNIDEINDILYEQGIDNLLITGTRNRKTKEKATKHSYKDE